MTDMARIDHYSIPQAPGEVLKEKLLGDGRLTQAQLARALGVSEPRLTMIFKGRCQVSAEIALRVERVFGISPHFWMRVRDEYELYHERQRLCSTLAALPSMEDRKERSATVWLADELQVAA